MNSPLQSIAPTRPLGRSGLSVAPLVIGGNVFGWTADESTTFALLDAFTEAGFNTIDTSNGYSRWVPGHRGGESETLIGRWLTERPGMRQQVLIATKVGSTLAPDRRGLSRHQIATEVEQSLRLLQTDYIDLYQSHLYDEDAALEETLDAYASLVRAGKVRAIGASNHTATQLARSLAVSANLGLPRYECLQPRYNLYDRQGFETELAELCRREKLGVIPYFSLASGFLTGKYRSGSDFSESTRGQWLDRFNLANLSQMFDARGRGILAALDRVSQELSATPAQVALAWLLARGVTAPIASATRVDQLRQLMDGVRLSLPTEALDILDMASAPSDPSTPIPD